jgi:hypothetical protein
MIVESSWVSLVTVKCLWNDRKLVFGLNFWAVPFSSYFHFDCPCTLGWVFFSLISYLRCLCLYTVEYLYQANIQSLHFHFSYIENKKTLGILH